MDDVRLWEATPGKLQGSVVPAPVEGEAERIVLWTQVITGMKLDDDGAVRVLDAPTWRQRRQRLEEMGGPPIAAVASDSPQTAAEASGSPPRLSDEVLAWHRDEAKEAADKERHWFGALFHPNRLMKAQPGREDLHYHRGNFYAYLGQWEKAAADFVKASELMLDDVVILDVYSLVRLRAGDTAGYRQVCADMFRRLGQRTDPVSTFSLARTGMRIPQPIGNDLLPPYGPRQLLESISPRRVNLLVKGFT